MDSDNQRPKCYAQRVDGTPCTARVIRDGLCIGHQPDANQARSKGGSNSSKSARLGKLVPTRLRPVYDSLEKALEEVHAGKLDHRRATAMASLAGAMVRVLVAGELEGRVRNLEAGERQ